MQLHSCVNGTSSARDSAQLYPVSTSNPSAMVVQILPWLEASSLPSILPLPRGTWHTSLVASQRGLLILHTACGT